MMTNKFPNSPRYDFAKKKAINTIITSKFCTLPVSPAGLIIQHYGNKIKLSKYSVIAAKINKPIEYVCQYLKTKDGLSQYLGNDNYLIIYNDTIRPDNRITFTLAHELGHIVLGHHLFNEVNILELSDKQHDLIEKEANAYAAELLAPTPVSKLLLEKDIILSSGSMQRYYNLSKECSEVAYKNLILFSTSDVSNYKQKELFIKLCTKPKIYN